VLLPLLKRGKRDLNKKIDENIDANVHAQYLDAMQTPILVIDRDFNITYINEFGAGLLGSTPEKVLGKKCYSLFKTDDCQTPKCACAIAMKTKKPTTSQSVSRAKGNELPIQYTGSPILDEKGKVIGAVELINDITELKTITDAGQRLANYLEGIKTPIMTIDPEFNVVYMNDFGARLLGSTPEKVLGKKCYDLFRTDDCQTPKCACAIAMKTKKQTTSQSVSRARGGELPIQYTGSPLLDEKGKVIGAVELVNDITELNDAMSTISNVIKSSTDVSEMVENLSGQILNAAQNIGAMGTQSAQAAEKLSNSMQQVQSASQNVSDGAQSLSKLAQETATNVQTLMQKMTDVNENTDEVNKIVESSNKLAQNVSEGGRQALKSLDEIKNASLNVESTIGEVNSSIKNVAGLTDDISQIAGQVNMLALNAAIEAARAGEAGRGFAVVADAVKQLAGQAGTAAKTAVESIDDITKAGDKAGNMSKSAGQAAKDGDTIVSEAVNGSQQVASSMEKILSVTQNLGATVQEGVKSLETVNGAIQQVAGFSEESASASEEASASIEEQVAATEEVATAAKKVQEEGANAVKLSQQIVEEVKKLKEELSKVDLK
jgi:methyl-accepting chemotaxis protein